MSKVLQDAAESLREAQSLAEALEHIFGDIQDELKRGNEGAAGMLADIGNNTCQIWQQLHAEVAYTLEQILERMGDGEMLVDCETDIEPGESVGDQIDEVLKKRAKGEE